MCCLFGLIDYGNTLTAKQKEKIIKILSTECEARGTDATGIAYIENNKINIYKKPLPAHKMKFHFKSNPTIIMGHTRLTTQGNEKCNYNNHPFISENENFALAHNGVLYNDVLLRKTESLPKTKIETDSYIAVQLIENQNTLNFSTIKNMAEKVEGSFCFTILDKENNLYIIKGDNPMAIAKYNGFYIYASTEQILNKALKKLKFKAYTNVPISTGDILKFDCYGNITKSTFEFSESYTYYDYIHRYRTNNNSTSKSYYLNNNNHNAYTHSTQTYDDGYLYDLIQYGKMVGVDEETITELLELGYDYMDIEEMLYDAEMMDTDCYVEDVMCSEI